MALLIIAGLSFVAALALLYHLAKTRAPQSIGALPRLIEQERWDTVVRIGPLAIPSLLTALDTAESDGLLKRYNDIICTLNMLVAGSPYKNAERILVSEGSLKGAWIDCSRHIYSTDPNDSQFSGSYGDSNDYHHFVTWAEDVWNEPDQYTNNLADVHRFNKSVLRAATERDR